MLRMAVKLHMEDGPIGSLLDAWFSWTYSIVTWNYDCAYFSLAYCLTGVLVNNVRLHCLWQCNDFEASEL
jgi:hypothetical protein